jgi:chemotaxis response regulator CheB
VALPLLFGSVLTLLAQTRLNQVNTDTMRMQNTAAQQILVVENHLLLGAGLENLLSRKTKFEVVGISPRNEEELVKKIKELRPATIILDEATYQTHSNRLLTYLRSFQELQLVVVSTHNNTVQIYHKQNFLLTQVNDFIEVLS